MKPMALKLDKVSRGPHLADARRQLDLA